MGRGKLGDFIAGDGAAGFEHFLILRTGAFEEGKAAFFIAHRAHQREGLGARAPVRLSPRSPRPCVTARAARVKDIPFPNKSERLQILARSWPGSCPGLQAAEAGRIGVLDAE